MRLDLTRQMFRQRSMGRQLRFLLRLYQEWQVRGYFFFATQCLELFETKLQLRDRQTSFSLLASNSIRCLSSSSLR